MKTSNLIKVATQSIIKNKMRTLLTMLGIIIGVGAVIVMVAVGMGARSQIRNQINGLGTNLITITPGSSNAGGVSQGMKYEIQPRRAIYNHLVYYTEWFYDINPQPCVLALNQRCRLRAGERLVQAVLKTGTARRPGPARAPPHPCSFPRSQSACAARAPKEQRACGSTQRILARRHQRSLAYWQRYVIAL